MPFSFSPRAQALLAASERDPTFTDEREVKAWFDTPTLDHAEAIIQAQVELGGYRCRYDQGGLLKLGMGANGDVWDHDPSWEDPQYGLRVVFGDQVGDPCLHF